MKTLRTTSNIKTGLFILAIAIIVSSLLYTNWIVGKLRDDNQKFLEYNATMLANALSADAQSQKYREERRQFLLFNANLYANALAADAQTLDFAFNEIIRNIAFPIIITVKEGGQHRIYAHKNLSFPVALKTQIQKDEFLLAEIHRMDRENHPIPVTYLGQEIMLIHFGSPSEEQYELLLGEIMASIDFPVIITRGAGENREIEGHNIELASDDEKATMSQLQSIIDRMDVQNDPIPVLFGNEVIMVIHYSDSGAIRALQWFPLLEIFIITIFVLLGFAGFQFIRNSERRGIWVGMSKETAHQLGTPLSSLMGWVELLKDRELPPAASEIVADMEKDVQRLYQVAERFSKIGAAVKLQPTAVDEVINPVVEYIQRRIPQWGKQITVSVKSTGVVKALTHAELLGWALENIMKNAVDAIHREEGQIEIRIRQESDIVRVDVSDNGRGIHARDHKNVFRPGWSSKQRGWGLGLSLVERIIREYHHGSISLSSTPGVGTTFHILLKAAPNP